MISTLPINVLLSLHIGIRAGSTIKIDTGGQLTLMNTNGSAEYTANLNLVKTPFTFFFLFCNRGIDRFASALSTSPHAKRER